MFKKLASFKESLKEDVTFNKKEYILTLLVCILGGILFGMIITPKKELTIGSFNGNGWEPKELEELKAEEDDDK